MKKADNALTNFYHFGAMGIFSRDEKSGLAYNSAVSPDERFYGIHLDVEPYVLPGFGGRQKQKILREYIELQEKLAAIVKNSGVLRWGPIFPSGTTD